MTEFRLKSLDIYNELSLPTWGPSLDELDMDNIVTYVSQNLKWLKLGKRFLKILKRLLIF